LSIKAADMADEDFERQQDEILEGLKPGDDMVDLAGAFDDAMGLSSTGEEWRPGDKGSKRRTDKHISDDER
jgi:hypothetical protein